jgi:uncharacterized protein with FMN-binding domain
MLKPRAIAAAPPHQEPLMTPRPLPRTLAVGFAGLGLVGALAGCSTGSSGSSSGDSADTSNDSGSSASTSASYKDGSYTEDGNYTSPGGPQSVTVKLTLADDKVTAVTVTGHATDPTAKSYQKQFVDGISAVVVGKDIDSLNVSRVAGSSLTSGGFNDALKAIKADAIDS